MRHHRTALFVAAWSVAAFGAGCGGDDGSSTASTTTRPEAATATTTSSITTTTAPSTSTTSTSISSGASSTTVAGTPTSPPPSLPISDPIPDGTSFGFVTAISIAGSTITIDIAELLTGDAAVEAAIADGALEPGETSIDNDYYVRNRNPKLRTAPVATTAPIKVLSEPGSPDLSPGGLDDLAVSLGNYGGDEGPRLPVQIVVVGGVVTRLDEVFFP